MKWCVHEKIIERKEEEAGKEEENEGGEVSGRRLRALRKLASPFRAEPPDGKHDMTPSESPFLPPMITSLPPRYATISDFVHFFSFFKH